jgi:ribokinase
VPDDRLVAVTHGDGGATLETPDDLFVHDGFGLPSVDSTGAGDAFAAGFLAAWLDGDGPAAALAVGNACGALGAAVEGPKADLSWDEVEAVLCGETP